MYDTILCYFTRTLLMDFRSFKDYLNLVGRCANLHISQVVNLNVVKVTLANLRTVFEH